MLIVASVLLCLVVLYNLGVMSYMERYREMATLKVLGFRNKAIGRLLISQNLWISMAGTLLGIPAGIWALDYLMVLLAGEYEMEALAAGCLRVLRGEEVLQDFAEIAATAEDRISIVPGLKPGTVPQR